MTVKTNGTINANGAYSDSSTRLEPIKIVRTCCQRIKQPLSLAAMVMAAVSISSAQEPTATSKFVPFTDFVQNVKSADVKEAFARPNVKATSATSLEEMRQHLLKLYQGVNVGHSYVLGAQTVDCIPTDQQPAARALGLKQLAAEPPSSAASMTSHSANGSRSVPPFAQLPANKTTDEFGNALGCEDGTIPMLRITLDQLSNFKTLHEFFEKGPNGSGHAPEPSKVAPAATFSHKYGYTYQWVNNLGDNTNIGLWRPYVYRDINEVFTLAQSWTLGVSSAPIQSAEVGWQNYPDRVGTENSVPFIYYTADGYNRTGCYDLTCGAFVQVNRSLVFGIPFAPQFYSVPDGPQYELQFQYYLYNGNWWLMANGTWIGYYPGSVYGGGQLSRYSNLIEFGGEAVGLTVWPAEGSGLWASNGWTYSAYQRELWYRALSGSTFWDTLTTAQPSPACYSVTNPAFASNWGIYFFFGGPGGASCQ